MAKRSSNNLLMLGVALDIIERSVGTETEFKLADLQAPFERARKQGHTKADFNSLRNVLQRFRRGLSSKETTIRNGRPWLFSWNGKKGPDSRWRMRKVDRKLKAALKPYIERQTEEEARAA